MSSARPDIEGSRIVGVRRVFFSHRDEVDRSKGPIELSLDGNRTILLDAGPDGEGIMIRTGPWVDPFQEPLSPENEAFVSTSGKWTAFADLGVNEGAGLLDGLIVECRPIVNPNEKEIGMTISTDVGVLRAEVEFDEMIVTFAATS